MSTTQHKPVLLQEVLTYLDPKPGSFIVDGTVDGGGHAAEIIARIGATGTFLGLDWDKTLLARCRERLADHKNVILEHANYADLAEVLEDKDLGKADGLLIDLGFSSEQLDASGRGFSFAATSADEPLLMTYDDSQTPVHELLRQLSEKELADIIFNFGGERMSRQIAKAIKDHGRRSEISTAGELARVIRSAVPGKYEHGRIDAATRTFQALRIYANGEFENLTKLLETIEHIVKPGGRVVIITFHSLEDGMVKRAFQALSKEGKVTIITKKPVPASREEIKENPRSRSAKIRVIQKN